MQNKNIYRREYKCAGVRMQAEADAESRECTAVDGIRGGWIKVGYVQHKSLDTLLRQCIKKCSYLN